uniref:Lipocalin n=1 Tax=Rhipicephalus zambeziensis TaxID=60191 RepID=A0A224YMC2_9ACAR
MTPLALAVLASVFIASHGKWDHPIWQNESRLQEYQIAWKSLNKSSDVTYYQLRATELISGSILTNKEQLLETNYSCWSVNMLNLKQDKEKGVRRYHYMVTATGAVHFMDEEVETVSKLNYTTKNAVEYVYDKNYTTHADPVIFSDGEMCDLFNVPRVSNQYGCELWVKDKYKNNVPPCCSFIYDLLCAVDESYEIYDEKKCQAVVESSPGNSG